MPSLGINKTNPLICLTELLEVFIFLSEQSEKVELEAQNAVTSLVKQGWTKKGIPFSNPPDSHCQYCLFLPSLLYKVLEAVEQKAKLHRGKLPIPSSQSYMRQEERQTLCHWLSPGMPEPFPAHSRLGGQAIGGRASCITGLRGQPELWRSSSSCRLGGQGIFIYLVTPGIYQCHMTTLFVLHHSIPRPKCHITFICKTSQENREVAFSAFSPAGFVQALLLYCQYHGTSLLECLSKLLAFHHQIQII